MDFTKPISAEIENNKLARLWFITYLTTHRIKFVEDKTAMVELGVYIFHCIFKSKKQMNKASRRTRALFYQ